MTTERLCMEPHALIVERSGDDHTLNVNVQSGFFGWDETFALTRAQAEALVADRRRRALLYGVLHHRLQNRHPVPPERFRELCDLMAFGAMTEVERAVDAMDGPKHANGAIRHLAGLLAERQAEAP